MQIKIVTLITFQPSSGKFNDYCLISNLAYAAEAQVHHFHHFPPPSYTSYLAHSKTSSTYLIQLHMYVSQHRIHNIALSIYYIPISADYKAQCFFHLLALPSALMPGNLCKSSSMTHNSDKPLLKRYFTAIVFVYVQYSLMTQKPMLVLTNLYTSQYSQTSLIRAERNPGVLVEQKYL